MVLWADLLSKVEAGDLQLTDKIGWKSPADVKRALIKLAHAARGVDTNPESTADDYSILQESFGANFEHIREDLAQQRVVLEPEGEKTRPSPEHLILGFALHLGHIAAGHDSISTADLADHLRAELEPVLSQDQLTEALFVALQLSAFPNSQGVVMKPRAKSALLVAWASSQNSRVEPHRLRFWAQEDLTAYLEFVEEVFVDVVSEWWIDVIIEPIKTLWRKSTIVQPLKELELRMRQWLLLVWKCHDLPSGNELTIKGHVFPLGRTEAQLTLSYVALALLSTKPIDSFLPTIALAWATEEISTRRHRWSKTPDGPIDQIQDMSCKDIGRNAGAILRWRYTESVRPVLESLKRRDAADPLMLEGLGRMLRSFDNFGWTRMSMPEVHLSDGKPIFGDATQAGQYPSLRCSHLAMRDDLPDLCLNDRRILTERVESLFKSGELHHGRSGTSADFELESIFSWFAKYNAQRLAELGANFRRACLGSSEVGLALDFANRLPFAQEVVDAKDLLREMKLSAERELNRPQERFKWSLVELHVLALTCLSEAELTDWLEFASKHKELRRELHFYPIPILVPQLLPDGVATFARNQAIACFDEPVDDEWISQAPFDFWAYLAGLAGKPDLGFHVWVQNEMRRKQPAGNHRYSWQLLWLRSAPEEMLVESMGDGSIVSVLGSNGLWTMVSAGRWIEDWTKLNASFNTLMEFLPISDVGTALMLAKRESDLARWGQLIFDKALELVGHPGFERKFWGSTIHVVDVSGEVVRSTCDQKHGPSVTSEGLRPPAQNTLEMLTNRPSIKELERQGNEGIRIWREDLDNLKKIGHEALNRFGASNALHRWRDMHPEAYRKVGSKLLELAAADASKAFHLGGFIASVVDGFVSLDPDLALKMDRALRTSSLRVNMINQCGVSTFVAAFWHAAGIGNSRCEEICEQFVRTSKSDEELMFQAIAAQAEGAGHVLSKICVDFLKAPCAKDRCLAISLLAWISTDSEVALLAKLAVNDPSGWIRKHAAWAMEIAKQERGARRYYSRLITESNPINVVAQLQVLEPALTSTSNWWHFQLERQNRTLATAPLPIQAALSFFWYQRSSSKKPAIDLFGRNLGEYLRGERIYDLQSPKPELEESSQA